MTHDNPAARLLAILERGKFKQTHIIAETVWMDLLDVDRTAPFSVAELMSKLGQFMILPYETQKLFKQYYPAQSGNIVTCTNKIQEAFLNQSLSGKWETFIGKIDSNTLDSLSLSSALLDNALKTKLIENDILEELNEKISSLYEEVISAELPDEFKRFMSHYLRKIKTAIDDYFISGAMPIMDALTATIGQAVIDPDYKDTLAKTEVGKKIRDTLADLANVVTVASAAVGATAYITTSGFPLLGVA